jgi:pimeloyl-ACP methyl ester carboxylesterase
MNRWQEVVEDTLRVADAAGFGSEPFHLIGVSLGGLFAMGTALLHADRVSRIALFAPAHKSRIAVPHNRRLRILQRAYTNPQRLYELPFGPAEVVDRADWQHVLEGDPLRTRFVSARFLVQMFGMQKFVRSCLKKFETPTLLLLGGRDRVIDNSAVLSMVSPLSIPLEVVVFEHAAHIIPSSVPRSVIVGQILNHFHREDVSSGKVRVSVNEEVYALELLSPPPPLLIEPAP